MKLHWSPRSPYVRKVMMCAHELGLVDRLQLVRSVAAMLKPNAALMHDNPLSKIPTLVRDDGLALFDSRVICEYLDEVGNGSLYPRTGDARWHALRWQAFGDGLLDALILWRNERERSDAARSVELIAAFELKTSASLAQLELESAALGAADFGIGHVAIACALGYLDYRFDALGWRSRVPALARWHASIETRPSYRETLPVDG